MFITILIQMKRHKQMEAPFELPYQYMKWNKYACLMQYLGSLACEHAVLKNDELTVAELQSLQPKAILLSPGPGWYTYLWKMVSIPFWSLFLHLISNRPINQLQKMADVWQDVDKEVSSFSHLQLCYSNN